MPDDRARAMSRTSRGRLARRGIAAIDAPMSGGRPGRETASMSLMVACEDAVFERHRELIEALSRKVFRISPRPGDGARTKLVNNLLAGINLVGAAEAMAMAQRMGLDLADHARRDRAAPAARAGSARIACAGRSRAITRRVRIVTLLRKGHAAGGAGADATRTSKARWARRRATCSPVPAAAGLGGLDDAALFKLLSESEARGR